MITVVGASIKECSAEKIISFIEKISKECGCQIQIFDADMILGRDHIYSAVMHAKRAFDEKRNAARTLPVEILRYASGERQIGRALSKMGISEKTRRIAVLILGDCDAEKIILSMNASRDDTVLEPAPTKLKRWGIKEKEEVLEKVAQVDVL